jgi:DNA-directed RNA polymerase subunit RPC12/RpoP
VYSTGRGHRRRWERATAMAISFVCPNCGVEYRLPDAYAGKVGRCKKCSKRFIIPRPDPAEAPVPIVPVPRADGSLILMGSPASQSREVRRRRKALIVLGVLLIAVFFTPVFGLDVDQDGTHLDIDLINIFGLTKAGVPTVVRFLLLHPVIVGIATIVVGCALCNRIRGVILLVLFFLPVIVVASSKDARGLWSIGGGSLADSTDAHGTLLVLGALTVLVGAGSRRYRPTWGHLYWIGLAGAVLLIASQFTRSGDYRTAIPIAGMIKDITRFSSKMPAPAIVSGIRLLAVLLLFITAILCVCNHPGARTARSLAAGAFTLCIWGLVLLLVADLGEDVRDVFNSQPAGKERDIVLMSMLFNIPKMLIWVVATLALLPVGLIDLIIGKPEVAQLGGPAADDLPTVIG